MSNILAQYYRGITQQLQAEVNFINAIFEHQGVKGEGNEGVLRNLLTKFIPKRYGIGTGIVIDRYGNQSKQADIVIYDTFLYPSLLSLTTVHLFPVEIVYATIEVKTTLDSNEAVDAREKIASVRKLEYGKDMFLAPEPDSLTLTSYYPGSPVGFVFAYNSSVKHFKAFETWFTPTEQDDYTKYDAIPKAV